MQKKNYPENTEIIKEGKLRQNLCSLDLTF